MMNEYIIIKLCSRPWKFFYLVSISEINKQIHPDVIEQQQQFINEQSLDGFQDPEQQSLNEIQTIQELGRIHCYYHYHH